MSLNSLPLEQQDQQQDQQEKAKSTIHIKKSELPACCPPKDQAHWNQHPRVYLVLGENGEANCPYCGNHFELKNT